MKVDEAIRERRSVRLFKKSSIPSDAVEKVLDAGRWAPTGCNKQLFEVISIEDPKLRRQVARLSNNQIYFYQAPVVLLVLYDESKELLAKGKAPDVPAISGGAFVQNMLLQAYALGIGSLVVSAITKKKELKRLLRVPDCYEPMCFVLLGYPDEEPFAPPRRELGNFVHSNTFGNLLSGEKRSTPLYPNSPDPRKWSWKEYVQFKKTIIHYAGPIGRCEPMRITSLSMTLLDIVSMRMKDLEVRKVLDLFPTEALFLRSLAWRILPNRNMQFFALEFSRETARYVKHILDKNEVPCHAKALEILEGNDVRFPFKDESFDSVTCFFRLENVPDRLSILRESWRVLRENGSLFIAFFNKWGAHNLIRGLTSLNKPRDFNKRWHWLLGPWAAPSENSLREEMKEAGFRLVDQHRSYSLPSILRILGVKLFSLIGLPSMSKEIGYAPMLTTSGLLPSVVLLETRKQEE